MVQGIKRVEVSRLEHCVGNEDGGGSMNHTRK